MTPYYSEETVYSKTDLEMENEDGVSIIYYLQKIFPGFKYTHTYILKKRECLHSTCLLYCLIIIYLTY